MTVVSLLDRPTYSYGDVDRIVGLASGTARRWVDGYHRGEKRYDPILREEPTGSDWVTWGEFVEVRILAEYREQKIPTVHLRGAVEQLRAMFKIAYPLANLRPYLEAAAGELAIDAGRLDDSDDSDDESLMVIRTKAYLLGGRGRQVMEAATLAQDDAGEKFARELAPDSAFADIVVNPDRRGGEPTFVGRRVSIPMIAGLIDAGEAPDDVAVDYGLSIAQVRSAVAYCQAHGLAS